MKITSILRTMQAEGQKYLTDEEYFEQFDRGISQAKDRKNDELLMMFWLYGNNYDAQKKEERRAVMPVGIGDWPPKSRTKREVMQDLGALFAKRFPEHMLVNIVHIAEAVWQVRKPKDTDENMITPSEDPARVEAVFVTARSMDRRISTYMAGICRDKDGKFTGLKQLKMDRHNPAQPHNPLETSDYLSENIYEGYISCRSGEYFSRKPL